MEHVQPKDAATVILLREADGGFETLLMQRVQKHAFMGGAHVFPGGRMDEADGAAELRDLVGLDPARARAALNEPELSPERALGLFVCAARELFEEAGVLLAEGARFNPDDAEVAARLTAARGRVHAGELSLMELARAEGLRYALDRLVPYARWITPTFEKKRFDARFFLTVVPKGQSAEHDRTELIDSSWLTPAAALSKQRRGEIALFPPTLVTLEELASFNDPDQALAAARERPVLPVAPIGYKTEDHLGVILPNDPDYDDPNYKRPYQPGQTSRVILKDGRWRTVAGQNRP